MIKTSQETLVNEVASELSSFLKDGTINPGFLEKQIDFKGIKRIQDLESILRIHFVLSDDVFCFLNKLPSRVRRIKTESKKQEIRRRGGIRGKVDWGKTITEQKSLSDKSLFISQNPTKNYDLPENLVLKKLLSIIHTTLDNDLEKPLEEDYSWLKNFKENRDLVNRLKNIYQKNVYINKIKDPREYEISDRDISAAENSRKELYKESAKLLVRYRKLVEGDYERGDLKELLNETLILPGYLYTLFELYSIFKLLCRKKQDFDLRKIKKGNEEIAVFELENKEIEVYHDSTGNLSFHEKIDEIKKTKANNRQLERYRKSVVTHANLLKEILETKNKSFYSGRPDFLIEHYEENELSRLEIGEIKYSDRKQVFTQGLKELIQYVYFARKNNTYQLENTDIRAILIMDKINFLEEEIDETKITSKLPDLDFKLEILTTPKLKKYKYN